MQLDQQYGLDALVRIQGFMDANGVVLGALASTPARAQLNAAVSAIQAQSAAQVTAGLDATGLLAQQQQAVQVLRQQHMQPIAKFARANLAGVPDITKLTNSGLKLRPSALVLAANGMATAAAPYAPQLTAAGFPPDALAQLSAAADAVGSALQDRGATKLTGKGATAGIKDALKSGRQAVEMLDSVVSKLLVGNAVLLTEWQTAKRIVAKPGGGTSVITGPTSGSTSASGVGARAAAPPHGEGSGQANTPEVNAA